MRSICPVCKLELKKQDGRRYLKAKYTEYYNVGHSLVYKFSCKGDKAKPHPKHEFLIQIEYPLDNKLAPTVGLSYNWKTWNEGEKTKPGMQGLSTTESQYSVFIHSDTAKIFQRLLSRNDAKKKIA